MINLGEAPEQKEGGRGPIPPKSIVLVKMEIRKPKKADPNDPALTVFSSGMLGLDCEFTVAAGRFEGVRIWENLFLPPGMQTIELKKGQIGICNSCFAKMRAIIEATRGLDPADPAADRTIQSWFDLHNLTFPVKVGIDQPKPGDQYLNNRVEKVLTMADEHYADVMAGGEVITAEPLPEIPAAPQQAGAPAAGGWNNGGQAAAPPAAAQGPKMNVPAWAQAA